PGAGAPPRVAPARWAELLEPLRAAGLVTEHRPGPARGGGADPTAQAAQTGDPSATDPPTDSTVAVIGLGPVGTLVALGLTAAGVGALLLDDPGTVRAGDVSPGGYRRTDVGLPREQVLAR